MTDAERDAVPVLARALKDLPTPVLRRMADSDALTVAAVARAILDLREGGEPLPDQIFPS